MIMTYTELLTNSYKPATALAPQTSPAYESKRLFTNTAGRCLGTLSVFNKGSDAYVFVFDSSVAAVPGSDNTTIDLGILYTDSTHASWATGTPCRQDSDPTVYYMAADADEESLQQSFTLHETWIDAMNGVNPIIPDCTTIHVLDWPAALTLDVAQNATKGYSDENMEFEHGIYVLSSTDPSTYAAGGNDFKFTLTPTFPFQH
jgi:hypothetical protein